VKVELRLAKWRAFAENERVIIEIEMIVVVELSLAD